MNKLFFIILTLFFSIVVLSAYCEGSDSLREQGKDISMPKGEREDNKYELILEEWNNAINNFSPDKDLQEKCYYIANEMLKINIDKSIEMFRKIIDSNHNSIWAIKSIFEIANIKQNHNIYDEAIILYKDALAELENTYKDDSSPLSPEKAAVCSLNKAIKFLRENQNEYAMYFIESAYCYYQKIAMIPEVLYSIGKAYWGMKDYGKAIEYYNKVISEYPHSDYAKESYSSILCCQAEMDGKSFKEKLEEILKSEGNIIYRPYAILWLSNIYWKEGNSLKAMELKENIIRNYTDPVLLSEVIESIIFYSLENKDFKTANDYFDILQNKFPNSWRTPGTDLLIKMEIENIQGREESGSPIVPEQSSEHLAK